MKKVKKFLFLVSLMALISSCGTPNSFPAQTNPDTSQFDAGYTTYSDDTMLEEDYSNIIAFTDKQEYPTTFDKITVTKIPERAFTSSPYRSLSTITRANGSG